MHSTFTTLLASAGVASAARTFLEYLDTGAAEQYGTIGIGGQLSNVSTVVGLPDFQYLAEQYMNILPQWRCWRMTASDLSSITKQEIQDGRAEGQVTFLQLYINPNNDTATIEQLCQTEEFGFLAIVLTVDSAGDGNRHRAARFGVGSADTAYTSITWEKYNRMRNQTKLPIVPNGIQTVEDAVIANQNDVPALFLSNYGGRQIDGSPSSLEVALESYEQAPWVFDQTDVWADGVVRYVGDIVKLLALGVKAVGIGRPFIYANTYPNGTGVKRAIDIVKRETALDAANICIGDLKQANASWLDWKKFPTWAQGS